MSDLRFSEDHEWLRIEGDTVVVGITDYAQQQLGDIVFIDLPEVGKEVKKGEEAAVVESVKAASEVYASISGTVTEVNESLADEPAKVNMDPENEGWFFKMKPSDPSELVELMEVSAYKDFVAGLG
jgi:glycine cleavage system H protein